MDTFYAFWNAEQIRHLFEAIVFICGGADFLGLLKALAVVGVLVVTTAAVLRQRPSEMLAFYFALALMYGVLVVPKATVIVRDVQTGANYVVANVPYGAALVANVPSHIGYWLTNTFETAFIPANDTGKFSKFGMAFPERAVAAVQRLGAVTAAGRESINTFTRDCIIPEMIDTPAKANEVFYSADIWTTVSAAGWVNPARATVFASGDVFTCDASVAIVQALIVAEYDRMKEKLGKMLVPEYPDPSAVIAGALPQAETLVLNLSRTFEESMRQAVMMDAVPNGLALAGAAAQPLAMAVNVASSQANLTSTINYRAMMEIAREALPKVRSAIEYLLVALFPIVVLMAIALAAGAATVIKGYLVTLLSVELWPALCAAINYLVVSYDASPMTRLIAAEGGNSLSSLELIRQFGASSQDVAGMLTLSVPLIAYTLVSGAGVAATSMLGSFLAPASGTAQQMGGQLAAGNLAVGNVQWGSINTNNRSANLQDGAIKETTSGMATITDAYGSDTYSAGGGPTISRAASSNLGPLELSRSSSVQASNADRSGTTTEGAYSTATSSDRGLSAALSKVDDAGYAQRLTAAYNIVSKFGDDGYMRESFARDASTASGRQMTSSDAFAWINNMQLSGDISAGLQISKLFGKGGKVANGSPSTVQSGSTASEAALGTSEGAPGAVGGSAPIAAPQTQGSMPLGSTSRQVQLSPALSATGAASATANANKTNTNTSASSVGTDQKMVDSKDFGAVYAASLLLDAGSSRGSDQHRGEALRANLDEMQRLQESASGSTTTRMSGGTERSSDTTISSRLSYSGAADAYGALAETFGNRADARRAFATGDRQAQEAVARVGMPGSERSFGGRDVQAPQPPGHAAAFGETAQGAAAGIGRGWVTSFFDAGVRRIEQFVGGGNGLNDVRSTPQEVAAFKQYVDGAKSYFRDQRAVAAREQDAQVGIVTVAAALDGHQFRGGLSSLKLAGEAIGLSSFKDGHQFLEAVNRVIANRDSESLAVAAIRDFGARVKAGNVSEMDVRQFAEAVRPAITRVMQQQR